MYQYCPGAGPWVGQEEPAKLLMRLDTIRETHVRYVSSIALGCLLAAVPVFADPVAGEMSQQMQLNQASQQELYRIQNPAGAARPIAEPGQQPSQRQLDRQQQGEQQMLQESQRRQTLLRSHRSGAVTPPSAQNSLEGLSQQRQFELQQQYQLNRFRSQRGSPLR